MNCSIGGLEHAVEDLPITAVDLHSAVNGHADHGFEAVNDVEILAIVDSGACLNEICRKWRANLFQISMIYLIQGEY